jgi:hypothetical protein
MPNGLSPENEMALVGGIKIQYPPQTSGPRLYGHHQGQQQQGQGYPFQCDKCPQSFQRNAELERRCQMRPEMGRQEEERLAPRSDKLLREPNGIEQMSSAQFHLERMTEWPMARPVNQPQNLQQAQREMSQYKLEQEQPRHTAVQAAGQLEAQRMILQGQPRGMSLGPKFSMQSYGKGTPNIPLRTPSEERHNFEPTGQSSQRPSFDAHFLQTNQNLANSLQGGVANPSKFEFQRAATDADAERHIIQAQQDISFHFEEYDLDLKPPSSQYDQRHEANDAANGLYLLAQTQTPHKNGVQQPSQAQVSPPHGAFVMPSQLLPASSADLKPPKLNSEYSGNILQLPSCYNIQSKALSNSTYPRRQMSQSRVGVETYDPRLHLQSSALGIPSNNRNIFTTAQPYQQFRRVNPPSAPFPPERNPTAEHEILTLDRSREHVRLLNEGLSSFPVNMWSEIRPHNNVSQPEPWRPVEATGTQSNPSTASNLYLTTTESASDKFYANPSYESPELSFSALSYNSILSGPSAASSAMGSPHSIQGHIAPASEWPLHIFEFGKGLDCPCL